jgi:hypothetical protein
MDNDMKSAASRFGQMGGKALHDKYGKKHFQELQKKSVEAKLRKKESLLNEAKLAK